VIEFPPALLIGEAPNVCIITADASRQLVNHHTIHERYYIVDCLVEALELRVRDSKKYDVVQVRRAVSWSPGRIPPPQRHAPVRRIALPTLVILATLGIVAVLGVFFRGSAPRRMTFKETKPIAHTTPVVDGWMAGLPDQPTPFDPPPKPLPPVDDEARRDIRTLRKLMSDRDEHLNKTLDDIRKLLAQRQTSAPAKAATPPAPDPLAEMRQKAMASELHVVEVKVPTDEPQPHDGMVLLPAGTSIPIALETAVNSDREGTVVVRVTTQILDAHGRVIIPYQATLVGA
jgi:type IV secretory pathway VirB10-like protein